MDNDNEGKLKGEDYPVLDLCGVLDIVRQLRSNDAKEVSVALARIFGSTGQALLLTPRAMACPPGADALAIFGMAVRGAVAAGAGVHVRLEWMAAQPATASGIVLPGPRGRL